MTTARREPRWKANSSGGKYLVKAGDIFYHVTPEVTLDKIRKEGLQVGESRTPGFEYPTGNYLFSSEAAAVEFRRVMETNERDEYGKEGLEFVILTIKLPEGTELLQDPFSDDESGLGRFSFYTPQKIGKECIDLGEREIG